MRRRPREEQSALEKKPVRNHQSPQLGKNHTSQTREQRTQQQQHLLGNKCKQRQKRRHKRSLLMINSRSCLWAFKVRGARLLLLTCYIILAEFTFVPAEQASSSMTMLARPAPASNMIDGASIEHGTTTNTGGSDGSEEQLLLNLNRPLSNVWFGASSGAANDQQQQQQQAATRVAPTTSVAGRSLGHEASGDPSVFSGFKDDEAADVGLAGKPPDGGGGSLGANSAHLRQVASLAAAEEARAKKEREKAKAKAKAAGIIAAGQEFGGQAEQSAMDHQFISVLNNQSNIVVSDPASLSSSGSTSGSSSVPASQVPAPSGGRQLAHYVASGPFSATTFSLQQQASDSNNAGRTPGTLSSVLKTIEPADKTIKSNGSFASLGIQVEQSTPPPSAVVRSSSTSESVAVANSTATTTTTTNPQERNLNQLLLSVGEKQQAATVRTNDIVDELDIAGDNSGRNRNEFGHSNLPNENERSLSSQHHVKLKLKEDMRLLSKVGNSSVGQANEKDSAGLQRPTKMIAYSLVASPTWTTDDQGESSGGSGSSKKTAGQARHQPMETEGSPLEQSRAGSSKLLLAARQQLGVSRARAFPTASLNEADEPAMAIAAALNSHKVAKPAVPIQQLLSRQLGLSIVSPAPQSILNSLSSSSSLSDFLHQQSTASAALRGLRSSHAMREIAGSLPVSAQAMPVLPFASGQIGAAFDLVPQTSVLSATTTRVPFEARKSKQTWRVRDGQGADDEEPRLALVGQQQGNARSPNEFGRTSPAPKQAEQQASSATSQRTETKGGNSASSNNQVANQSSQQQQTAVPSKPNLNEADAGDNEGASEADEAAAAAELFGGDGNARNSGSASKASSQATSRQQETRKPTRLDSSAPSSSSKKPKQGKGLLTRNSKSKLQQGDSSSSGAGSSNLAAAGNNVDERELLVGPFKSEAEAPATITLAGVVYQKSGSSSPLLARGGGLRVGGAGADGRLSSSSSSAAAAAALRQALSSTVSANSTADQVQTNSKTQALKTTLDSKEISLASATSGLDEAPTAAEGATSSQQQPPQSAHWPGLNSGPIELLANQQQQQPGEPQVGVAKDSIGAFLSSVLWPEQVAGGGGGGGGLRFNAFPLVASAQRPAATLQHLVQSHHEQLLPSSSTSKATTKTNNGGQQQQDTLEVSFGSASNLVQEQQHQQVAPQHSAGLLAAIKKGEHYYLSSPAAATTAAAATSASLGDHYLTSGSHGSSKTAGPIVIVQKDVKPVKYHLLRAYLKLRRLLRPFEATYVFANDPSAYLRRRLTHQQQASQQLTNSPAAANNELQVGLERRSGREEAKPAGSAAGLQPVGQQSRPRRPRQRRLDCSWPRSNVNFEQLGSRRR